MSGEEVRFSCTVLNGMNKQGIIRPDSFGYYVQPLGGLNVFNSAGDHYDYEGAKNLFESSSAFMRRVSTGCLKAEEGHPVRLPGMTDEAFIQRVMKIDETRVCAHIAEIWLDFDNVRDRDGNKVIAIMGKIKPYDNLLGQSLKGSYDNPKEDVCFSIRAFTTDRRIGGVLRRTLVDVITFDRVTEPGIAFARKFHSPSLEAISHSFSMESISGTTVSVSKGLIESAMENNRKIYRGLAMESSIIKPVDLYRSLGWDTSDLSKHGYMAWR